jgi:hypothetical protein
MRATTHHTVEQDAIQSMSGKRLEDMSTVHTYIAYGCSELGFRNHQLQWSRWVLHAPITHMVTLVSKYAIDATIRGWF